MAEVRLPGQLVIYMMLAESNANFLNQIATFQLSSYSLVLMNLSEPRSRLNSHRKMSKLEMTGIERAVS